MAQCRLYFLIFVLLAAGLGGCASGSKSANEGTDAVPATAEGAAPDTSLGNPLDQAPAVADSVKDSASGGPSTPSAVEAPDQSSAATGSGELNDYKVRKGDTLMKIAYEYYGDLTRWKEIYQNNKDTMSDPNQLTVGKVIRLDTSHPVAALEGEKYMIQTGDTLGKVSNQLYGTPRRWKELYEKNKQLIRDPNKIFAGFYLYYTPDQNSSVLGSNSSSGSEGGTEISQNRAASAEVGVPNGQLPQVPKVDPQLTQSSVAPVNSEAVAPTNLSN